MHLLLTRTTLGSQILAVSEDRQAAMLMGIRPDRMQALAWAVGLRQRRHRGRPDCDGSITSPLRGGVSGLIAFRRGLLWGFGSVPGAMLAGLIIGLIQAASAYYIGPCIRTWSSSPVRGDPLGPARKACWGV